MEARPLIRRSFLGLAASPTLAGAIVSCDRSGGVGLGVGKPNGTHLAQVSELGEDGALGWESINFLPDDECIINGGESGEWKILSDGRMLIKKPHPVKGSVSRVFEFRRTGRFLVLEDPEGRIGAYISEDPDADIDSESIAGSYEWETSFDGAVSAGGTTTLHADGTFEGEYTYIPFEDHYKDARPVYEVTSSGRWAIDDGILAIFIDESTRGIERGKTLRSRIEALDENFESMRFHSGLERPLTTLFKRL